MKFTLSWLKEHLETPSSAEEIGEALTSLGLEVERIENKAAQLEPFIIAEILEAERHPSADKLQVCKVNNGGEILQIVCGAANARAGLKVVLAPVGSVIPTNNMQIKAAKIRGVESNGMLCSAAELGLEGDSEGIIEIPGNALIGEIFAGYAGLDDTLFEIAITPNRGDCLGVRGIARDLAAKGLGKLKSLKINKTKGEFPSPIKISVGDNKLCPLFIGRYFKNMKNQESPEWLKKRLSSIGLKTISALVDITNYISYDLGRPLHVYDAAKLKGNIKVRQSKGAENFLALDDKNYALDVGTLVVADESGPVALAGVMGGKDSGCSEKTAEVFLEVAIFDPATVAKTGRQTMINSDSRYRFERGLDHNFAREGAEAATALILEICGGQASELEIVGEEKIPERKILFKNDRVRKLGGIEIADERIIGILEALGFKTAGTAENLEVLIPSWRNDVSGEADLVEEVLRVDGYDNIMPASLPVNFNDTASALSPLRKNYSDLRRVFAARGMMEVVSFSFMSSKAAENFAALSEKMKLINPISSDLDVMRPSIIPNLLEAAKRNIARGLENLAFFEIGPQFSENFEPSQQLVMAGIRTHDNHVKNIYKDSRAVDFFDAKADAIAALPENIKTKTLDVLREVPPYYHPGKSGSFRLGKNILAVFGELHPGILAKMEILAPAIAFEIYLENIPLPKSSGGAAKQQFLVSNFQHVERDFAFVLDEKIAAGDVIKTVKATDKDLIEEVRIFDLYKGKGIEEGKKSLGLTVRMQPKDRTMQMAEIDAVSEKIIAAVGSKLGGRLRN